MRYAMPPPWKVSNAPWGSIAWRMGSGEDYWGEFREWYLSLSQKEKSAYKRANPEPWGWRDFYSFYFEGGSKRYSESDYDTAIEPRGLARGLNATRDFVLWGLAFWPVLFALGFLNGVLRVVVVAPMLGEKTALPLSSVTALALMLPAIFAFMSVAPRPWWGVPQRMPWPWLLLGASWTALTVGAEFLLFVGVMGARPSEVTGALSPAAVLRGNLLLVVLAAVAAAPYVFHRLQTRALERNLVRYYKSREDANREA